MAVMLGFTKEKILNEVQGKLAQLTTLTRLRSAGGDQRVNKAAEDFYCGLLNIILDTPKNYPGINLVNMNTIQSNYPAIDLGDAVRGVAIQVTTTEHRTKVTYTLDKFFEKKLQDQYQHLIILVIGKKDETKKKFDVPEDFDWSVWDLDRLGSVLGDLTEEKLQEVDEYFEKRVHYLRKAATGINLPLRSVLSAGGFVGREEELKKIGEELRGGTKPVFLSGLGGMGKTELAVRFAREYEQNVGNAYMVTFQDSFRKTLVQNVAAGIPSLQDTKLDENDIYQVVLQHLSQLEKTDLLIIDNAHSEKTTFSELKKEEAYKELCGQGSHGLKMRLLMTTRFTPPRAIKVERLPNEKLYDIFQNHGVENISQQNMDDLIQEVNGHTITVDLLARTLVNDSWRRVTPAMLLEALRERSLPEKKYKEVESDYAQSEEQGQIYDHLRIVFNVAGIPPVACRVLCCASLLPQGGMDAETFGNALTEEEQDALDQLIRHGWLSMVEDKLTIHPVIRMVAQTELDEYKPECPVFLTRLHENYHEKNFKVGIYGQMAQVYISAIENEIPEEAAMWHFRAGWYLWKNAQYQEALKYEQYALTFRENMQPMDELLVAASCNDIGLVHNELAQYDDALAYFKRAYETRQRLLSEGNADTARSCNNMGDAYHRMGKYGLARDYKEKALNVFIEVLSEDDLDLATSYNNVGVTYDSLSDHRKALENHQKALLIREAVLPPEHPDLAYSYNCVATSYYYQDKDDKALYYQLKALIIQEKVLSPEHPDLACSYNNVGNTYGQLSDHGKSLEYHHKALIIREKVLPREHPELASSYNNVGCIYRELDDNDNALKYHMKALSIREKVLSSEHPNLATSYANLSVTYYKMKDYRNALNYAQEAVRAAKRCQSVHPDLDNMKKFEKMLKRIVR